MITTNTKKITRATIKSFVTRESKNNNLYIKVLSSFDGMVDCVMPVKNNGFTKAVQGSHKGSEDNTLGIAGVWLVGSSRDYFEPYADDSYIGYEVSNSCGSFLVAMGRLL